MGLRWRLELWRPSHGFLSLETLEYFEANHCVLRGIVGSALLHISALYGLQWSSDDRGAIGVLLADEFVYISPKENNKFINQLTTLWSEFRARACQNRSPTSIHGVDFWGEGGFITGCSVSIVSSDEMSQAYLY